MANLYLSEFQEGVSSIGTTAAQILPQPPLADQVVPFTGTSAQSAAFNAKTRAILVSCDAVCSILIGASPTATASNFRLPANCPPIAFAVQPGQILAVISNT